MKKSLAFLFFVISFPYSLFALEPRCFTEYTEIAPQKSSPFFVTTEKDDIFFTQNSILIPSRIKQYVIRESFDYDMKSNLATFPIDATSKSFLTDDVNTTIINISPTDRDTSKDFTVTLTFKEKLLKNTFVPNIDIQSNENYILEISDDNQDFVLVNKSELVNFSFQSIRLIFQKTDSAKSDISFKTIRFNKLPRLTYLVSQNSSSPIMAYRGWICDEGGLIELINKNADLNTNINISVPVSDPIMLDFKPIPTEGKDIDNDGIIDLRDNCPTTSNPDQKDRNFDGIGDACSDDDNDGISGSSDNCPTISNPDQKDINANSIGDACEFDSDSDGIPDGVDNCIHTANPDQNDSDKDGIGDVCDNCKIFNPDQLDFNKNGIGDTCDTATLYNKTNDEDKDGILDNIDNCIHTANPDQNDSDKDGIGDACDNCLSIKNTDQRDNNKNGKGEMCEDEDLDGIDGWRDNCPTISNPDQKDSNNDSVGDVCSDSDNDGIYDGQDNCPAVYNLDQKDTDNDNIGNACDQKDDRILESNRTLFIALFGIIALCFIGGIIYFIKKITF